MGDREIRSVSRRLPHNLSRRVGMYVTISFNTNVSLPQDKSMVSSNPESGDDSGVTSKPLKVPHKVPHDKT